MIHGRLKNNGAFDLAPKMLLIDGNEVWFPTHEQYVENGYLPVSLVDAPQTDYEHIAVCTWIEDGDKITQQWHIEEAEPTAEEVLDIMLGGDTE